MINNIKHILKNEIFLTFFLSGLVFLIVLLFSTSLVYLDKKLTYNVLSFKNQLINFSASQDIIIVEIDNKTLNNHSFPLSRNIYAESIRNLKNAWVSVIWIDVIFWERSLDDKADTRLAYEIANAWNVIIGWGINNNTFYLPFDKFRKEVASYWYFNPEINIKTNSVYSFSPFKKIRTNNIIEKEINGQIQKFWDNTLRTINFFSIEVLKYFLKTENIIKTNTWISFDNHIKVPFSRVWNNEVLINYLPRFKFKKYSLLDIYENNIKKEEFEWKIVLIWATADWLKDIFDTPNWRDFGVYIHANSINTILSGKHLIYFNSWLEFILLFLLIILAIYFNFSKNNRFIIISNISIIFIFIFIVFWVMFFSNLIFNHPTLIILAFILSIVFSNIAKYLIENKDKKKILKALWEYISKDIANKILKWEWWVKLEWEKKTISIFFSDIAWFTSISEKMDAIELVEFLREYLWKMSHIIMDERWFINKYEWDAIIALFWVFGYEQSSNYDNCKTALLQQEMLKILNIWWKEKYSEILSVRMWLHFWEAIIWNIWAVGRKMEFTALWDSVNLASRLEWVNKYYSTDICVSETVYEDQKKNFEFRKLDIIRVKWKNKPITIYELLSFKDKLSKSQKWIKIWFEKALELYFQNKFIEAWQIFKKLWELWDKPSLVFSNRCFKFELTPPKSDWEWIWNMIEK